VWILRSRASLLQLRMLGSLASTSAMKQMRNIFANVMYKLTTQMKTRLLFGRNVEKAQIGWWSS
jgi:hypothetical protein